MAYDPFTRGRHPVGVRSGELDDTTRGRRLPVELWYPATAAHTGADLADPSRDRYAVLAAFPPTTQDAVRDAAPANGRFPLVVFSHGFGGHRRQSTFLCTHLASHGYVVASPDHVGNTVVDMMQVLMDVQAGKGRPDPEALIGDMITARPRDASAVIDFVLDGVVGGLADRIDHKRIGVTGHSFGGWTTLMTAGRDARVRAALPLAPAGGTTPLGVNPLKEALHAVLRPDGRVVPTLYLASELDTLLPLHGIRELVARTAGKPGLAVLKNADHMHFCDRVEETHELFRLLPQIDPFAEVAKQIRPMAELCPGAHAYEFVRGLGLAHLDAALKEHEGAAALLAGDLAALLAARGVAIEVA